MIFENKLDEELNILKSKIIKIELWISLLCNILIWPSMVYLLVYDDISIFIRFSQTIMICGAILVLLIVINIFLDERLRRIQLLKIGNCKLEKCNSTFRSCFWSGDTIYNVCKNYDNEFTVFIEEFENNYKKSMDNKLG